MVAVQLAMGQFSPRIVRALLQDRVSHLAYGLFASTFTFAILALREVGAVVGGTVPGLTVLMARSTRRTALINGSPGCR